MRQRSLQYVFLAVTLALAGSLASAASLQVAPTGLTFEPSTPAQGLWLTNTGTEPLHAQVRVFQWTQADGKDELKPTQALVASPPILNVAPGAKQLVRVIRPGAPDATAENAYRLLVDELPQAADQKQSGVQYLLRYSIPVFTEPAQPPDATVTAAALHWSVVTAQKGFELEVQNSGHAHAQLSAISLRSPGGQAIVVTPGLLGYALPGATMRWPLKFDASQLPADTQLTATVNGKSITQPVVIVRSR